MLLIRFCRALAAAFGAFADSLAQSTAPIVDAPPAFAPGEQLQIARQAAAEMMCREHLHAALRRFSPTETTPEA